MKLKGRIYLESKCVLKFSYVGGTDPYWMDRDQKATLLLNQFKKDIKTDLSLHIDENTTIRELKLFTKVLENYIKEYMEPNFPYIYSWRVDYPEWRISSTSGVEDIIENANENIKHETFIKLF